MGHLLSSAIKMQGGALPPPTLEINNNGGIFVSWEKNGISQGSVPIGVDVTLSYGDTIKVIASNPLDLGAIIEYYLNSAYVTTYSDTTIAETPTISTFAGGEFKFDCYSGF